MTDKEGTLPVPGDGGEFEGRFLPEGVKCGGWQGCERWQRNDIKMKRLAYLKAHNKPISPAP